MLDWSLYWPIKWLQQQECDVTVRLSEMQTSNATTLWRHYDVVTVTAQALALSTQRCTCTAWSRKRPLSIIFWITHSKPILIISGIKSLENFSPPGYKFLSNSLVKCRYCTLKNSNSYSQYTFSSALAAATKRCLRARNWIYLHWWETAYCGSPNVYASGCQTDRHQCHQLSEICAECQHRMVDMIR